MSNTYSSNLALPMPALDDAGWDVPLRSMRDMLDALATLSAGAVRMREVPSTSLFIAVAPAAIRRTTGQLAIYAGATLALTASTNTYLWLTDTGTLGTGSAWPSGPYTPLAVVATGTGTVTSIADARVVLGSVGVGPRVASTTQTTTYIILPSDGLVKLDATAGAFTATLPSASTNPGMVCRAIKTDASANVVTVGTTGGQAINGAATLALASQWSGKTLVSDGANWEAF